MLIQGELFRFGICRKSWYFGCNFWLKKRLPRKWKIVSHPLLIIQNLGQFSNSTHNQVNCNVSRHTSSQGIFVKTLSGQKWDISKQSHWSDMLGWSYHGLVYRERSGDTLQVQVILLSKYNQFFFLLSSFFYIYFFEPISQHYDWYNCMTWIAYIVV